jgi:MtN3 and saliva related transmembrane protein
MDLITLVGTIAATCTTVAFLPQVIKVRRTRHAKDLSFPMYVIFCTGVACWLWYGFLTDSLPIIIANIVTFVLGTYILAMKIRFDKQSG